MLNAIVSFLLTGNKYFDKRVFGNTRDLSER